MKIEEILSQATRRGTSDVHFSVGRPVMIRVDGQLMPLNEDILKPADVEAYIMPLLDERKKQTLLEHGEIDFAYSLQGTGRFRLNVFRQRGTFAAALRLLPFTIPTPQELKIPNAVLEMTSKKRGLVLVTGPTGSGKSTTLASLINVINETYPAHVITLEDPIEYLHKSKLSIVNQREIGLDTLSYTQALRAALRQDPDVILLGELRDLDTISTAVTAAETGHLVFSTLHTIGAASTIDRIVDVFPPHQQEQVRIQLATVLECVVSQQLIPTDDVEGGRCAAFEVMVANPAIRNLIREGKTFQIASMMQTGRKRGMITMDDALYELFVLGRISAEKALEFAQDYSYMSRKVY
ncbi:type IV pilus twitching motility protein PilT [bacterium C-53]|nr:type IV pilus twitching motility protein PilT [Lachnospiraceae bacterium]NBI03597.1 type IV pilus twitching motility protein PilT [Lachnospiraceae bacterium]RKJ09365.1 type IV pilus twitching motility protein PilT [bacterium C-53]